MKILILILFMLISMGFYLLIERKLMSLMQYRLGPNKIMFKGMIQFIIDMIKLLMKEQLNLYMIKMKFYLCLLIIMFISMIFWFLIYFNYMIFNMMMFFLIMFLLMLVKLIILSLFLLMHKSMYMQISFIRVIVQFISYDIMLILIIIFIMLIILNFNLINLFYIQKYLSLFYMNYYLFFIWLLSLLMEILRLPFDFYESESELISGFNLELSSLKFMLLFMMEYLDMVYFLNLSMLMFFFCNLIFLYLVMFLMLILWIRIFIIRYRYDKMLILMWMKMFFYLMMFILVHLIFINFV